MRWTSRVKRWHLVTAVVALGCALALFPALRAPFHALRPVAHSVMGPLVRGTPAESVIQRGQEREMQALFTGHPLGSVPLPGWRFMQIASHPRAIDVQVDGPDGRVARMTLRHPDDVPSPDARSRSFAIVRARGGDPDGERALDVLVGDLQRNDDGRFWRATPPVDDHNRQDIAVVREAERRAEAERTQSIERARAAERAQEAEARRREASRPPGVHAPGPGGSPPEPSPAPSAEPSQGERVRRVERAERIEHSRFGAVVGRPLTLRDWITDGGTLVLFLLLALAMALARALRDEGRNVRLALAGIVVAGALYRVVISVPTTMDVWPYSRLLTVPHLVYRSLALAWVSARFGLRIHLNELVHAYTLCAALLTPLAVFVHARALLRDTRAALWASAVIATLPAHVRFSFSETGFIPSAVFASMTFALISQSLRDPSRLWRALALVAVPVLMIITMEQRALNTLFPALYLVQIWLLQPPEVPRARRVVTTAVMAATAAAFVFGGFLEAYQGQIHEGLQARTLLAAAAGLTHPRFNTLIHFGVTPPLALALVLYGLYALWRGGQRRLAAFLVVWPGLFYTANAVIGPSTVEMQTRYHLHLAAPFALAAGAGAKALLDALAGRVRVGRAVAVALGVYLALVPRMHLRYERSVSFNDVREYEFVRAARGRVPHGCTVLEHYTPGFFHDLRFERMGRVLERGAEHGDFHAVLVSAPRAAGADADPIRSEVRAILADPPDCLMFYQGLPCYGVKQPDEPIAPACAAIQSAVPMDRVTATRFRNAPYDEMANAGVRYQRVDIELGLYRVRVAELRARQTSQAP